MLSIAFERSIKQTNRCVVGCTLLDQRWHDDSWAPIFQSKLIIRELAVAVSIWNFSFSNRFDITGLIEVPPIHWIVWHKYQSYDVQQFSTSRVCSSNQHYFHWNNLCRVLVLYHWHIGKFTFLCINYSNTLQSGHVCEITEYIFPDYRIARATYGFSIYVFVLYLVTWTTILVVILPLQ